MLRQHGDIIRNLRQLEHRRMYAIWQLFVIFKYGKQNMCQCKQQLLCRNTDENKNSYSCKHKALRRFMQL